MRFRLRTLLIVLALGPPILAALWLWGVPAFPLGMLPKSYPATLVFCLVTAVWLLLIGIIAQQARAALQRTRQEK